MNELATEISQSATIHNDLMKGYISYVIRKERNNDSINYTIRIRPCNRVNAI